MTTINSAATSLQRLAADGEFDEAQLAVAAFLARFSGRTLDAYRHDLRDFFQWSAGVGLTVLTATGSHRALPPLDGGPRLGGRDDRPATVCGYYRFAHIDGRIPSNPAQFVRRPKVRPSEGHRMDRGLSATDCSGACR
jgi:integrase/recombinase XerD